MRTWQMYFVSLTHCVGLRDVKQADSKANYKQVARLRQARQYLQMLHRVRGMDAHMPLPV